MIRKDELDPSNLHFLKYLLYHINKAERAEMFKRIRYVYGDDLNKYTQRVLYGRKLMKRKCTILKQMMKC